MKRKLPTSLDLLISSLALGLVVYAGIIKARDLRAEPSSAKIPAPSITLTPYLLLDGTCKSAMEFYQQCLGGELTMTTVGDSPMKAQFPSTMHHKVVNARLVSGNITLYASDWLRPQETPVQGNTVCLYLSGGSATQLKTLFEKLSEDAKVTDPLREGAFGLYGALNDKFGIRWMFHAVSKD